MLLFGVLGTASPQQLYQEMLGSETNDIMPQGPTRFYMFLFAIREIVMAAWLLLATVYLNDDVCRCLLWSILGVLMPAEAYLWISSRSFLASEIVAKNLTNQAIFVVYLILSVCFGK